jgi:hypothetical protein
VSKNRPVYFWQEKRWLCFNEVNNCRRGAVVVQLFVFMGVPILEVTVLVASDDRRHSTQIMI